jgi:hypothetical protein
MSKIIFFNHYHRGDLLTHKEFIRQLQNELPDFTFEYMHFNHPKLTRDLNIPVIGAPENLDAKTPFYQDEGVLYINTWIGCFWDIFCEHGGINMNSLWHQWDKILDTINGHFNTEIALRAEKESYLPKIDFTKFDVSSIDEFLKTNTNKKILICNGPPKSGQSFSDNMQDFINLAAEESPSIDFICTTKFDTTLNNVLFTDDIIVDNEVEDKRAPWEDREVNNCDLQEISYLSEHCDAIVGKNSGPFVFCETYNNYMNPNKKFLSYNVSWGIGKPPTETMSNGLDIKCKYTITPISDISTLSSDDIANIHNSLKELTDSL